MALVKLHHSQSDRLTGTRLPACIPVSDQMGAIIHKSNLRNWHLKELPGRQDPFMLQVYDVIMVRGLLS